MANWLDIREIIEKRKVVLDNGCWVLSNNYIAYPCIYVEGKNVQLSRIVKEIYQNIKIQNLALHSCDNNRCFNPEHIFDGTYIDNMEDAILKGRFNPSKRKSSTRISCVNGHEFTPENTVIYKKKNGKINRNCRQCIKARNNWRHKSVL